MADGGGGTMYMKIEGAKPEDFQDRRIILFGASSTGGKAVEEFERIHADIIGFCDNNPDKKGTKLEGYLIYLPEDIKIMLDKDPSIVVMVTSTYEKEISSQLRNMGINNFYIVHMGVLHDIMPWENFFNKILSQKEANRRIMEKLRAAEPFFIGRIGATEFGTKFK